MRSEYGTNETFCFSAWKQGGESRMRFNSNFWTTINALIFLKSFPGKMPFTYVVNVYSDMSLSKEHLGSRGDI